MSKVGPILRVAAFIMLVTGIALIALQRTRPTRQPFSDDVFRCRELTFSRELKPCLNYLIHGHRGSPLLLRLNRTRNYDSNSKVLDECCQRLQDITGECRCDAIKQMLHDKQGELGTEQMRRVVRRARNLPAMCSLEPHRCNFRIYSSMEEIGMWKLYG